MRHRSLYERALQTRPDDPLPASRATRWRTKWAISPAWWGGRIAAGGGIYGITEMKRRADRVPLISPLLFISSIYLFEYLMMQQFPHRFRSQRLYAI